MKHILVGSALVLSAIAATAMPAGAQRRATFGFAAGATVPVGDLADATSTGFHALGTLAISGSASTPLGFRVDGMYNSLSGKSSGPDVTIWTVNGNLVFAFPGMTATPYLLGGAGWYNTKTDEDGAESSNNFGLNGGVGVRFVLSGFSTFAEARFHHVFADEDEITGERPSLQIIPLTFGIVF